MTDKSIKHPYTYVNSQSRLSTGYKQYSTLDPSSNYLKNKRAYNDSTNFNSANLSTTVGESTSYDSKYKKSYTTPIQSQTTYSQPPRTSTTNNTPKTDSTISNVLSKHYSRVGKSYDKSVPKPAEGIIKNNSTDIYKRSYNSVTSSTFQKNQNPLKKETSNQNMVIKEVEEIDTSLILDPERKRTGSLTNLRTNDYYKKTMEKLKTNNHNNSNATYTPPLNKNTYYNSTENNNQGSKDISPTTGNKKSYASKYTTPTTRARIRKNNSGSEITTEQNISDDGFNIGSCCYKDGKYLQVVDKNEYDDLKKGDNSLKTDLREASEMNQRYKKNQHILEKENRIVKEEQGSLKKEKELMKKQINTQKIERDQQIKKDSMHSKLETKHDEILQNYESKFTNFIDQIQSAMNYIEKNEEQKVSDSNQTPSPESDTKVKIDEPQNRFAKNNNTTIALSAKGDAKKNKQSDKDYSKLFDNIQNYESQAMNVPYGQEDALNDSQITNNVNFGDISVIKNYFQDMKNVLGSIAKVRDEYNNAEDQLDDDDSRRKSNSLKLTNRPIYSEKDSPENAYKSSSQKKILKNKSLNKKTSLHSKNLIEKSDFPSMDFVSMNQLNQTNTPNNIDKSDFPSMDFVSMNQLNQTNTINNDKSIVSYANLRFDKFADITSRFSNNKKETSHNKPGQTFPNEICPKMEISTPGNENGQLFNQELDFDHILDAAEGVNLSDIAKQEESFIMESKRSTLIARPETSVLVDITTNSNGTLNVNPIGTNIDKMKAENPSQRTIKKSFKKDKPLNNVISCFSELKTVEQKDLSDKKYEGWMSKQSRWFKKWRARWCIQTSSSLYTFEFKSKTSQFTEKLRLQDIMCVAKVKIEESTSAFKVCCQTKNISQMKTFFFYVENDIELQRWIKAIKKGKEAQKTE